MNALDWVLIAVFAAGALYGYRSGLVQSVLNLAGVFAAMYLSGRFATAVVSNFTEDVENEALTTAIGFVVIFIAVFIAAQIVGKSIRTALTVMPLGWVDRLGGIGVGIVIGLVLCGAVTTVGARYAYAPDEPSGYTSLPKRVVEDYLNKAGRDRVDQWLTESQVVPVLLDVREALPGEPLGMISGVMTTALDVLRERVDEVQAASG